MINKKDLINTLNNTCKPFFTESTFYLHPSNTNRFTISGDNNSKAINNYDNFREQINVIKWFDFFWIYIDIKFQDINTLISLSVFQGKTDDNVKHQLFRAEWDDYNDHDAKHPQPHWHVTANQAIEKTFEEIANYDGSDNFLSLLTEEKSKIIDVNKIHFAMIGNWINDGMDIHPITDETKIVKWFHGLLSHLRVQLEYVQ
ncbi:MAG TPA: hypothetical protein VIJ27_12855 [Mucilaginibacter sp.]